MSIKNPQRVSGLFAFWRYDKYPYVLGAVVDMMDDNGLVRAPSYGNAWFRPIVLYPIKKGKALLEQLKYPDGLEGQRRQALDKFEAEWDARLFELFPEARHPNIMRHNEGKKRGR